MEITILTNSIKRCIMAKEKKPTKVTLADYKKQFVDVYPTANNKYHHPQQVQKVHPDVAAALVKKGLVTYEKPDNWEDETEETDSEV
jgi:hypothetical protein